MPKVQKTLVTPPPNRITNINDKESVKKYMQSNMPYIGKTIEDFQKIFTKNEVFGERPQIVVEEAHPGRHGYVLFKITHPALKDPIYDNRMRVDATLDESGDIMKDLLKKIEDIGNKRKAKKEYRPKSSPVKNLISSRKRWRPLWRI